MKFLDRLCCTLTGLTLSAAGLLLLFDPVTTGGWLHCGTVPGIIAALLMLLAGMATLCGLRHRIVAPITLALIIIALIFNLLTYHIRLFGLSIILLPMAIYHLVYSLREGNGRAPAWFEWTFIGIFALFALLIPTDALVNLPRMEFGPYRVGADVRKTQLGEQENGVVCIAGRALAIAEDHIIAKAPERRLDSPRFQRKLATDPDRVMTAGILAGRLYAACAAAVLALLMLVCGIIKRHF